MHLSDSKIYVSYACFIYGPSSTTSHYFLPTYRFLGTFSSFIQNLRDQLFVPSAPKQTSS